MRFLSLFITLLAAGSVMAEPMYLRPVGDPTHYSDAADYPEHPADRPGFEWVSGTPPEDAQLYREQSVTDKLKATFSGLPVEQQAALGPLAASVLMFLENNNPQAAKLVIQEAQIPAELEPLRKQMLEMFKNAVP